MTLYFTAYFVVWNIWPNNSGWINEWGFYYCIMHTTMPSPHEFTRHHIYQRFCTISPVNPLCLQLILLITISQLMQLNAFFLPSEGPFGLFKYAIKINSQRLESCSTQLMHNKETHKSTLVFCKVLNFRDLTELYHSAATQYCLDSLTVVFQ